MRSARMERSDDISEILHTAIRRLQHGVHSPDSTTLRELLIRRNASKDPTAYSHSNVHRRESPRNVSESHSDSIHSSIPKEYSWWLSSHATRVVPTWYVQCNPPRRSCRTHEPRARIAQRNVLDIQRVLRDSHERTLCDLLASLSRRSCIRLDILLRDFSGIHTRSLRCLQHVLCIEVFEQRNR